MDNCASFLNINRSLSLKSSCNRILAKQTSTVLVSELRASFSNGIKAFLVFAVSRKCFADLVHRI